MRPHRLFKAASLNIRRVCAGGFLSMPVKGKDIECGDDERIFGRKVMKLRAGVNLNDKKLGKVASDDGADWREAWALFPGSVAYVWHAGRHTGEVQHSLEVSGFDNARPDHLGQGPVCAQPRPLSLEHEPCWYAVRDTSGSHWGGDRKQSTLWTINAREDDGHGHGTQKPVECMRRPIENNSSPGQAVYETFSGSGTTITGRLCLAMERS
jgi:hypothetical protein